jgi:GMP synthase-like glutamine amidotransferase
MRALHLHHDANSLPGLIGEVLADRDIEAVAHQVCEIPGSPIGSPEFPDPEEFDLIVVYGSRWSVYDDDVAHWVVPELDLLRRADGAGVPVLGLCFGGQMLSAAHGGLVAAADRPEIGWHRVQSHVPDIEPGPWLQWHFDIFTVPEGADELAASPSGPQAFRLRRNLALQFHPEADRDVIEAWFADDIDQIQAFEVDPDELLVQADRERPASRARAERLVRTLLD